MSEALEPDILSGSVMAPANALLSTLATTKEGISWQNLMSMLQAREQNANSKSQNS